MVLPPRKLPKPRLPHPPDVALLETTLHSKTRVSFCGRQLLCKDSQLPVPPLLPPPGADGAALSRAAATASQSGEGHKASQDLSVLNGLPGCAGQYYTHGTQADAAHGRNGTCLCLKGFVEETETPCSRQHRTTLPHTEAMEIFRMG